MACKEVQNPLILAVLKHTSGKIDYDGVAQELNCTKNAVSKRFKRFMEDAKLGSVLKGQILGNLNSTADLSTLFRSTTSTAASGTKRTGKRKAVKVKEEADAAAENEAGDDGDVDTPVKKKVKTKVRATTGKGKSIGETVLESIEEDEDDEMDVKVEDAGSDEK